MKDNEIKPEIAQWDSITADAHRLVYGDRGSLYSHPYEDYSRTVGIFAAMTGIELTVPEAILFMKAVKLSRLCHGLEQGFPPHLLRDSVVDDAGYSECLWGAMIFEPPVDELEEDDE